MRGFKQYENFKKGKSLTPKQAILAQCYTCNGGSEGGEDCLGVDCPLYQYMPYRKDREKKKKTGRILTLEQREKLKNGLKEYRRVKSLPSAQEIYERKRPKDKTF